jgi:hypothetical protein
MLRGLLEFLRPNLSKFKDKGVKPEGKEISRKNAIERFKEAYRRYTDAKKVTRKLIKKMLRDRAKELLLPAVKEWIENDYPPYKEKKFAEKIYPENPERLEEDIKEWYGSWQNISEKIGIVEKERISWYYLGVSNVVKTNTDFLLKNAKETLKEVEEFVSGSVFVGNLIAEKYVTHFYLKYIFPSLSQAIFVSLLVGNLPACFMELRALLECLVKYYYADFEYSPDKSSEEKIDLLERDLRKGKLSISELMKCIGKETGLEKEFISLWGKLSGAWIHNEGIVRKISDLSELPSWSTKSLIYKNIDINEVKELGEYISKFKNLQKIVLDNWVKKIKPYEEYYR